MMKNTIVLSIILILTFSCSQDEVSVSNNTGTSDLSDTTILNIPYGSHADQKYDIYLPAKRDSNTPILLMIHGGAWKAGQKEELNSHIKLIKKNWKDVAIVNMDYRLASNADNIHHAEIMDDIKSTIKHIIDNQENYHISSNMGILGTSAGGQLAMIYAYKYNDFNNIKCIGNVFGPSIISDWSWYNSTNIWLGGKVGDILTEYVGQPWDSAVYKSVSPYWNINSESLPIIMFHGSLDPIVPVYQSQWMRGKLDSLNVTNEYYEYPAFHGFNSEQTQDVVLKMIDFFQDYL